MIRLIITFLFFAACSSKKSDSDAYTLSDLHFKAQRLCSEFDPMSVDRCDRATFWSLSEAFGCKATRINDLERSPGFLARDIEPCYIDGVDVGSKSECSLDSYIFRTLQAISHKDFTWPARALEHLDKNSWRCGPGPSAITSIIPARTLLIKASGSRAIFESEFELNFRGYLAAAYIHGMAMIDGDTTPLFQAVLGALAQHDPESPVYQALAARWSGASVQPAIDSGMRIEECRSKWGGCPLGPYLMWAVKILEGI